MMRTGILVLRITNLIDQYGSEFWGAWGRG